MSVLANCRSQFLLDSIGRCLKLFVSSESTIRSQVRVSVLPKKEEGSFLYSAVECFFVVFGVVYVCENQFRNSKYSKQYKKAYEQHQEKTSRISRPCDEKGKARAFVDNRKDRRKKKQRSSKNKNTRRYSSLAGKKHCGDVCRCKRSQKVEGHDRLRLQQTRQLMMMMMMFVSHLLHTN